MLGGGRFMRTPSEVELIGQVVRSWFMSACAQSRAVADRCAGEGLGGRGLPSLTRRLPRSKVYGIGFTTDIEVSLALALFGSFA